MRNYKKYKQLIINNNFDVSWNAKKDRADRES